MSEQVTIKLEFAKKNKKKITCVFFLFFLYTFLDRISNFFLHQIVLGTPKGANDGVDLTGIKFLNFFPFVDKLINNLEKSHQRSIGFFVVLSLFFLVIFFFYHYLLDLIKSDGECYIKEKLTEKFSALPFEEKIRQEKDFNSLLQEANLLNKCWLTIPLQILSFFLGLVFDCFFRRQGIKEMNLKQSLATIASIIITSLFIIAFLKKFAKIQKESFARNSKEWEEINRQKESFKIIEPMGLRNEFSRQRNEVFLENKIFHRKNAFYNIIHFAFFKTFDYFFPLLLSFFGVEGKKRFAIHFIAEVPYHFAFVIYELGDLRQLFSSYKKINSFFSLSEEDENLSGITFPANSFFDSIEANNLDFAYQGEKKKLFKNYNHCFSVGKVNYLSGANGTGKSTLILLLLGLLKPSAGEIRINNGEKSISLKELNLRKWREQTVCYLAHETVFKEGSTGEKQWKNINEALKKRHSATLWIFDEADNALDKEKQKKIQELIEELINEKKLIIYIRHQKKTDALPFVEIKEEELTPII